MTNRRTRSLLWLVTGFLAVSAAAVSVLSYRNPPIRPAPTVASVATPMLGKSRAEEVPNLQSFQKLWALDLRKPLFDAAPVVVKAQPPPKPPPLAVKLTGTVVEPGNSVAFFQLPDGQVELKHVGEQTNGAEILSIEPGSVNVRYHGESITLTQKDGQSG